MGVVFLNAGKALVANRIIGSGTEPKNIAWGTSASAAAATDTALGTESADEARTAGTSSRVTTTVTNDTYQVVGTMTCAVGGKTITENGLSDAASAGNFLIHESHTGIVLAVGDSITYTFQLKIA